MGIPDSLGIREATLEMPERIQQALSAGAEVSHLPSLDKIDHILILGMGDSSFSGEIASASARPFSSCPIFFYNGYLLPSWVGNRTLVIAMSVSETSEETLDSLESSLQAGASLIAITNDKKLQQLAQRANAPVIPVACETTVPRTSVAALAVPAMLILEQLGLFLGAESWIEEAVTVLTTRRDGLRCAENESKALADLLESSTPIVYGAGTIGSAAAKRWKVSVNLYCKAPAFWAPMPDLYYNELIGWERREAAQAYSQIQLRHDFEHPITAGRFLHVEERSKKVMQHVCTVNAQGSGPVAQLLDLLLFGDYTSLELAARAEVDPGFSLPPEV